jgi:hypothetical protein
MTIVKIASNTSSVFDNLVCQESQSHERRHIIASFGRWLKTKTSDEKRGNPKKQGAQNKDL